MEWNTAENDPGHSVNTQHHSNMHVTSINNDDFSNINTNNYDLNQFTQLITLNNSNNHQDLIVTTNNTIDLIESQTTLTQTNQGIIRQNIDHQNTNNLANNTLNNLNNNSNLIKAHFDDTYDKPNQLSRLLLIKNNDEMVPFNNLFSNDSVNSIFIAEFLNSNPLETNQNNLEILNQSQPQNISQTIEVTTSLSDDVEKTETTKKLQLNRFNYKCNYCLHLTKFKAHIIEHMLNEHKIDLMQCPYTDCLKKFKDEWKLKRHLASNKEHLKLGTFRDLNDCLSQHILITPQKIGQYPCPLCQIDPLTGNIIIHNELDQETCIQNLINKNLDNSLFFDKYEELSDHCSKNHPQFNMDMYFICKVCGQVFLNRYKLSCHHFNVHSGKRKPRSKSQPLNDYNQDIDLMNSDNITDVIDSVAKGIGTVDRSINSKIRAIYDSSIQDRKYLCVVCNRKFKRVRDLQTHVQIMHKNMSDSQREELRAEIDKTNLLIAKNRRARNREFHSINMLSNNDPNTKICFICNKIFRAVQNHELSTTPGVTNTFNLTKSFQRHLQLQHGINEKGEKLIDCPVCEKSFFSKIQLERHLRTHQVWIEDEQTPQPTQITIQNLPEHRLKHSILYCHECIECSIFFKSIKILTKHKKDAHNLRPVFKCANTIDCNRQFDTIDSFLEHSKHHSQKNILCSKCKLKFSNKNTLRIHMKNYHYKTSLTKKTTTTNLNRRKNIVNLTNQNLQNSFNDSKETKNNKNEFICPTCGLEFSSRNSLHNHLATHNTSDLKLFMCTYCNVSFKTRKELSRHAASHDFQKHKTCEKCGETFKTSFHLKRHCLTRHSNLRPFKCNDCGMTFARKDKLKQHEAKHVNLPPYVCNDCGKGFYRKEHLKDHEISKHSKQYPFSCEHCNKGFVHAKDLHRHIRVRHLGNAVPKSKKKIEHPQENVPKSVEIKNNLVQTQKIVYQVPQINGTVLNNDFKSKKISSILKSNFNPAPIIDTPVITTQPVLAQQPILLTQTTPIQILTDSNEKMLLNQQPCQIITLRINDLNSILDKLNNNNTSNSNINSSILNQVNFEQPKAQVNPVNLEQSKVQETQKEIEKKFKCQTCSSTFFYENQLKKHMQTKHSKNPQFSCSLCDKQFSSRANAKYHIENGHVEFLCPICYKIFKNKSYAQRHIDTSHPISNQSDLKPIRQCKNEPKLIDLTLKFNKSQSVAQENIVIQGFENINNFFLEPKIDTNNNNNTSLVNYNFVDTRPNYSNVIWSSNPSTSSTSPSSVTQSPINQANPSLFILNNSNINQQHPNLADTVSLNNQSFFI
ncbi:unnamed protein product [Brachionus calyciflorus]|uniref:C2H2-type domain-containing protein n=1 Tax=Brachionus calyciflorus TaxID=104777 RepID=A0A813WL68_9BILA|nr:unnamed protein product [Brachionus calyciflorus]